VDEEGVPVAVSSMALWDRTTGAVCVCAERQLLTSTFGLPCSASHELRLRAFPLHFYCPCPAAGCDVHNTHLLSLSHITYMTYASWTWDMTHERALNPADLFGGKTPVGA